jgi:hypothetical protein
MDTLLKGIYNVFKYLGNKILPPYFLENVEKFAGILSYRRTFLIITVLIVYILCIILYELGNRSSKSSAQVLAPDLLEFAPYIFDSWFVYTGLTLALVGFLLNIVLLNDIPLSFIITAGVYLVSFPLLFAKFYYNFAFPSSALNVYTFNILLNSFFCVLNIIGNSASFKIGLGILCMIPSFGFAGFLLYCGKFTSS